MASGTALTSAIIATWPIPNYVDPVSQRGSVEAAIYATTIPMVLFVAGRIYVRANQKSGVGADDWIMVGAAVFALAISVCLLVTTTNSLGRHLYDVNPMTFVSSAKYNVASVTMYNASMTLTKLSVCMTYLKLFPSRTNKLFCWTMIGYQLLWGVISSALYILQCVPIQSLWDFTIVDKVCLDSHQLHTASGICNVVSDFVVFLWPVAPLWQVKLPLSRRVHLVAVFSFGVLTCVGGILKVVWSQDYFKTWDTTRVASRVTMALCIEFNVGIMSGCLPCLRPFLAMMAPGIFAGPSAAHSGNAASSGGASWRKSPFRFGNFKLFKIGAGKPSGREEDYEFTDAKHAGGARAWAAGGKEVPQASIGTVSGSGISVNRDEKLRDGFDSPGVVTNDATSEEWIMKEDSSR